MIIPRLKKRAEFLAVAAARKVIRTKTMSVQIRERCTPEVPGAFLRVGYTTSRRVGNAVIRNRARRRLRAVIRDLVPSLKFTKSIDMVLIATTQTATAPFVDLKKDFLFALQRLGILGGTLC